MTSHLLALASAVVLLAAAPGWAQVTRGPYLQLSTPSSVTVAWRTTASEASVVRYGADPTTLTEMAMGADGTDHVVTVTGLAADTKYFYSVGTASTVRAPTNSADAAQYFFRTAPAAGAARPFRFWLVGDDGTGDSMQAATVAAMNTFVGGAGQRPPDLFVHVGDMAYNSGTDTELTTHFFAPHANLLRHTVVWPAMGNHEGGSSNGGTESGPYFTAYVLPREAEAGGVASGTEAYYSFDYANAHFVVLDSFDVSRSPTGAMATWLRSDLMATNQEWIIAFFHHPPYTRGTHADTEIELLEMRTNILPILEAAGVDLVLAGHSHIYERSFLLDGAYATPVEATGHLVDPGSGRPDDGGAYHKQSGHLAHDGTVYVVAGHGGASLGGTANHPVMYFSEVAHGSCLIDVADNRLDLVNLRNETAPVVSDWFSLIKDRPPDGGAGGGGGGGGTSQSCSCTSASAVPWVLGLVTLLARRRRTPSVLPSPGEGPT